MQPEVVLGSETVFEGKIVRVRVDTVRLPNGGRTVRDVVEHSPSVVVVPIDAEDNVILVRQYRYPVGISLLEAPAGGVDGSESPEESAQRELQEETGYRSLSLRSLGRFWASPGYCTELMHAYLATELVPSTLEPDPDENIRIEKFPITAVGGMIQRGEIQDGKTIAVLLMATSVLAEG